MMTLAQLQQRFATAVVGRDAVALDGLLAGDPAQAAARTAVYSNNHHLGLREALAAIYPVVARLLGAECFELLARDYVGRHAKPSGNVLDYGEHFADLVGATEALAGLPYLADVARLEWLRHEVGRAADSDPGRSLSLDSLAALDDAALTQLRLQRVPAARLYRSRYPVLQIWQSNQDAEPAPLTLDEGGVKCLVRRAGLDVRFDVLDVRFDVLTEAQFAFLDALDTLSVCAAAELALHADPQFDLAQTLARWLSCLQHDATRSKP